MVWLTTILDAVEDAISGAGNRAWHGVKEALRPRSFGGPTWTEKVSSAWLDRRQALTDWWVYQPEGRRVRFDAAVLVCVLLMIATGVTTWRLARSGPHEAGVASDVVEGLITRARKEATDRSTPKGVRAVPVAPPKR